ncbi:hypothetical protein GCM10007052_09790 [Halioglobus japonicus]|uniref:DUF3014 domain-containing protein n=1 Tax=Halioglobus japonicus TaxID=930805 RepID=A0AAP8MFW4_9GAMM|nr:DUF3014 domain-containing protein [Halioglobus japonicus]PLW87051.1 hypothetical protein C0029_00135 [Halioglobus japonicus]GHD10473.1 hypothetical protein GCM10007052_09790 [Halioglobus japonicus]
MNIDNEGTEQPMQADQEDRPYDEFESSSSGPPLLSIVIGIILIALIGAWFMLGSEEPPAPEPTVTEITPAAPPEPLPEPEPVVTPAPDIPEPDPVEALPEPNTPPPPPPLALEDSDPVVRDTSAPMVAGSVLEAGLENDQLLNRMAGLIDATSQGRVFYEVFKLAPPATQFAVIEKGDIAYIDPASYDRYDAYTQAITGLDADMLAATFHTFRPLLEEAYASLGYKEEQLDNSLIRALDTVIAAPVPSEPAALEKDITTWHYVDPELENLSPLAKQLIRMGPDNQRKLQAHATAIRAALLKAPAQ